MSYERESYFDPSGRPVIVAGWGHLGVCPRCHAPIVEIRQAVNEEATAWCDYGCRLENPVLIRSADALTPTYSAASRGTEGDPS